MKVEGYFRYLGGIVVSTRLRFAIEPPRHNRQRDLPCAYTSHAHQPARRISKSERQDLGGASCQVAEHCRDPVGHAIVTYGYLFDGLIQARQREV
jgi:hypothetical protein